MTTYDYEMSLWLMQRAKRLELGDGFAERREIEQFAHFRRRSHARLAGMELKECGYTVALRREGLKTALRATRDDALDDESVAQFLGEVISAVERYNGQYDGWGAMVVPAPAT